MSEQELKKCSGCKFVRYCLTNCQTKDWKEKEHKKECKLLARNIEGTIPQLEVFKFQ